MIRNTYELVACTTTVTVDTETACDIYGFTLLRSVARKTAKDLVEELFDDACPGDESPLRVAFCVRADDRNPSPPAWVSVSERVPPGGSALVYVQGHGPSPAVGVAHYSTLYGWATGSMGYDLSKFITHWMPLPSPPQ